MKRIWIVSEYFYPIVTSTGYYLTEIAICLAKKGLDVHVICIETKYNEQNDYYFKSYEKYKNVHIHRIKAKDVNKNVFFRRILRVALYSLKLLLTILRKVEKGEELLVVTNPALIIIFLPFIKSIRKIKYNILVHDIFPDNLVAIGKISDKGISYRFLNYFFKKAYSQANSCISIGRDMSDVIKKKLTKKVPIHLITNWSDNKDVFPLNKKFTKLIKQLHLNDEKIVFQFAGNLGHVQGIENLLEAIRLVKDQYLHFLFIGNGAKYNTIRNFITIHKLENISLVGFQDRATQNDFLNACDIAIVTLQEGMFGLGVPSKFYNIMASGKPILFIGEKDSEIGLCINEYQTGWIVEPNNPELLKNTFYSILENPKEISEIQIRIRKVAEEYFAKDIILQKYYELLK
jgi:glycosyltransferase involved in cell wall biosynthesis